MLDIITNTVEMAKIETEQIKINSGKYIIDEIISEIYEDYQPIAREKSLIFNLQNNSTDKNQLRAIDREKLEFALKAILNNSFKFTSNGHIDLRYTTDHQYISIFIDDTGIGIPRGKQEQIFKPFAQGDENHNREYGGAGLGLSVARGFIEAMGGNISIESTEGKGTHVKISVYAPTISSETKNN